MGVHMSVDGGRWRQLECGLGAKGRQLQESFGITDLQKARLSKQQRHTEENSIQLKKYIKMTVNKFVIVFFVSLNRKKGHYSN